MPFYIFENPKTKETRYVIQKMNDIHEYEDPKGSKWDRIFSLPNAQIDTKIDPSSYSDFVRKTNNKKGTVGDLWDMSADLSEKRKKKYGKDPVKEKTISDYKKHCKTDRHPLENT